MKAVSFKPKKDVQDYLVDDFNTKLYRRLLEDHPNDKYYEPLSFFNQLYECLEIVKANKEKPIDVTSHLKTMLFAKPITKSRYDASIFILWYLKELVHIHSGFCQHYQKSEHPKDQKLKTCYEFILRLFNQMSLDQYPFEREPYTQEVIAEMEKDFEWDFWVHKEISDAINDSKQKLEYLVNKKAEYLTRYAKGGPFPEFPEQCEVEIFRIQDICSLKSSSSKQPIDKNLKLKDLFTNEAEYFEIMNLLVSRGICHAESYLWADYKKGYKGYAASLIKYLKPYFKEDLKLTNKAIIGIVKNTFGLVVSEDTVKRHYANSHHWDIILPPISKA